MQNFIENLSKKYYDWANKYKYIFKWNDTCLFLYIWFENTMNTFSWDDSYIFFKSMPVDWLLGRYLQ